MRLISVGQACEVAFEIRMHTPKVDADYFDWLITPFDGLIQALNSGFTNQLQAEDLYLQDDKNFVVNRRTGIKFGHVFKRDSAGDIITDFETDLDRVTSIFEHLSAKFEINARSGAPLGFVRRDLTPDQALIFTETISALYPELEYKIIAVNEVDMECRKLDAERFIDLVVPPSGHDGLGLAEAWAAEMLATGLTAETFVKTKDDVFNRLMVHQLGDVHTLVQETHPQGITAH